MEITSLIGKQVKLASSDAKIGTCVDLVIDVGGARILYALVGSGGAFGQTPILIGHPRLSVVNGSLCADVSEDDIADKREDVTDAQTSLNLMDLPPVVTGPFGHTFSPAMAGAVLNAMGQSDIARPAISTQNEDCFWFTDLQGLPVFEVSRELGEMRDIVIDPAHLRCIDLVTQTPKRELYSFPFDKIRNIAQGPSSFILELSSPPLWADYTPAGSS